MFAQCVLWEEERKEDSVDHSLAMRAHSSLEGVLPKRVLLSVSIEETASFISWFKKCVPLVGSKSA